MSRRHRDLQSSSVFHVVNRGVDHQDVFSTDADRRLASEAIADAADRCGVEIHAYALMTNHFHLVVDIDDGAGDLSSAMRRFQGSYAQRYNRRTSRTGPLFHPRFWAEPIGDDDHLLTVVRYVHRNPLDIVGTSGLVGWEFSSLPTYVRRRSAPPWLTTTRLGPMLDPDRHLADVLSPRPSDRLPRAFLEPQRRTALGELSDAVERATGRRGVDARTADRDLLVQLALELRVLPDTGLAERLEVEPNTNRSMARRGRVRVSTDPAAARLHRAALANLG